MNYSVLSSAHSIKCQLFPLKFINISLSLSYMQKGLSVWLLTFTWGLCLEIQASKHFGNYVCPSFPLGVLSKIMDKTLFIQASNNFLFILSSSLVLFYFILSTVSPIWFLFLGPRMRWRSKWTVFQITWFRDGIYWIIHPSSLILHFSCAKFLLKTVSSHRFVCWVLCQ